MSVGQTDIIDLLAGIGPGSPLDHIRAEREQARENAQTSYMALFAPAAMGEFALRDRYAVAGFVALLHRQPEIGAFYLGKLAECAPEAGFSADVKAAAAAGAMAAGPYGSYPAGVLSREDTPGPVYHVVDAHRAALGERLCAAFEHAHMLVFHPRDAEPKALQMLLDAGWTTTGIVTLSQLVAFLSFQIRVVTGLRALAAA